MIETGIARNGRSRVLQAIHLALAFLVWSCLAPEFTRAAFGEEITPAQVASSPSHSLPKLIADVKQIKAGQPFKLGVKLVTEPGWHTYYKESGDAGMPTRIEWTLPPGFKAGELLWEKPSKFNDAGITTYGYHATNLTAAVITPPADIQGPVKIKAKVKWLCCSDVCIPGKAELSIELPVTQGTVEKSAAAPDFEKVGWQGKVTDLTVELGHEDKSAVASGTPASGGSSTPSGGAPSASGSATTTPVAATASVPTTVSPTPSAVSIPAAARSSNAAASSAASSTSLLNQKLDVQGETPITLPLCFLFAFIGGFILNFMPCVLPVIALKVVGIVEQAHGDKALVQQNALAFTAGMVGTFLLLAGIVIAVQAAGGAASWGLLFQFPAFLVGMSVVVLLFALSLFGLFYVSLPNQGSVDKLASRNDIIGTFFKGVLATVLSTPCTAPFLGSALGFALTQNKLTIMAIFLTIGLGMASPYFLLMLRPDMLKFIPKPGVWMEKFKESMGFVLLATVVWLLALLGQTTGVDGMIRATAFLVAVSFAAWLVASFTNLSSSASQKNGMWALALSVVALSFYGCYGSQPGYGMLPVRPAAASVEPGGGGIVWTPYSIKELDNALQAKKTVLLDFTADWCLTCKVNEKTVLDSKAVTEKLKALNVVTMQADWTTQNPEISKILAKFNRSGVPLYVIFPGKNPTRPIVLPEVITQDLVLKALTEAGASS